MTFAKVNTIFEDRTVSNPTLPLGICAMAGITQRGTVGKAQLVKSAADYFVKYGAVLDPTDSIFPILALRALNNGAQLYISRVEHLTDVNDPSTTTATAATGNNAGLFNYDEAVFATNVGLRQIIIAGDFEYAIAAAQIHTVLYQGGGSGNLTVSAVSYASGYTTITYTTTVAAVTVGDRLTFSQTFLNTFAVEASSVGTWGNSVTFELKRSAANVANTVDVHASLDGADLDEVYPNFPTSPTATDISKFNAAMKLIQYVSHTAPIVRAPAVTLTTGTDDYASITEIDYAGSGVGGTGLHAFDDIEGFVKVCVPEIDTNTMDNTVLNYVLGRKDAMLAILHAPASLDAQAAIDYRQCTGVYTGGTKIDNWRAVMLYGGIKIISPFDGESELTISWVGDFIGLSATKDNAQRPWFSISGVDKTPLSGVTDIVYNINTAARAQEAEDLTDNGLLPIIKKVVGGAQRILPWGDTTLQVTTSKLQFLNVAELLVYVGNTCKPISEGALFKPNDPKTWKSIYRQVDAIMRDVQAGRGVNSFVYEGDQNAENINQATLNQPADIAAGKYKFNLYLDAIVTIREVTQRFVLAQLVATANGITVVGAA